MSYSFQQVTNAAFALWRITFVVIGGITIAVGLAIHLVLLDTPMMAGFLTQKEKVALLKHVSVNQTGIQNTYFKIQ